MLLSDALQAIRTGIAEIPADLSNDAVGAHAPRIEDMSAPEGHAAALTPSTPIVVGSRGAGKSFWAGILGQPLARSQAGLAYPRLKLDENSLNVEYGFTGVGGPEGVSVDALQGTLPTSPTASEARNFWWATVLRAVSIESGDNSAHITASYEMASNWQLRENVLNVNERRLRSSEKTLLIVYDALDTIATNWPRRRLLTESLLEVVWAMRAYRQIKLKLFLRPDQIDDDALRFVELPKLRTGAVRLEWSGRDLYGLLFARLALSENVEARRAYSALARSLDLSVASREAILRRRWPLSYDIDAQRKVMQMLAGTFMAGGPNGYKKGKTYDWPIAHLSDAFEEVTPRSFLGLIIRAATYGPPPQQRVITPDGIRSGLRAASKTRVDQLHQEFPWIKGVLAPLAGLLLPQYEDEVYRVWRQADTVAMLIEDAAQNDYLPPFQELDEPDEQSIFEALARIGVMFRRRDGRLDMPDLFRVAAKLLKKGQTSPER